MRREWHLATGGAEHILRNVDKVEMQEDEFTAYVASHPNAPLYFDGLRYTYKVQMTGLVWNKPVAFISDGKFFKLVDK